jgi:2-amino-4-hydroxy-6-hydroxymethyldihydropteridine diphosphokinase
VSAGGTGPDSAAPAWVIVALGSNLGDSAGNVCAAIERLRPLSAGPFLRSSLWRTTPVDCPPGSPWFVNAVVAFRAFTDESPESLHTRLRVMEQEFGRRPKQVRNEARPLDLDLIAFGAEARSSPQLTLPHPRALWRRFVLAPLAEILPDYVLDGQTRTVSTLLAELKTDEVLERLPAAGLPGQANAAT